MSMGPLWLGQLTWSTPLAVSTLRRRLEAGAVMPGKPGCYAITDGPGPLVAGRVLYVGRAYNLDRRLRGYLVNYMLTKSGRPRGATKHKGRAFVFWHRDTHGDQHTFMSWAIYGDPCRLEGALIEHFEPHFNSRWEVNLLADDEELDSRFLP